MSSAKTSSEQRRERLARALKANIARRKAAAEPARPAAGAPPPPPEDEGCPN
ncbi:MAG: hypothetical protein IOC86_15815 [Aestuariivirga sp.]|nr:hypothetical protein [Aestuariivirga sp.]